MTKPGLTAKHILVVEDEPSILTTLCLLLELEGYRVTSAADGQEGLERARLDPPDLVVTDYMMPHMDGTELTAALRATPGLAAIPVLMLSAAPPEPNGIAHPPDLTLRKPLNIDVILQAVARLLGNGR